MLKLYFCYDYLILCSWGSLNLKPQSHGNGLCYASLWFDLVHKTKAKHRKSSISMICKGSIRVPYAVCMVLWFLYSSVRLSTNSRQCMAAPLWTTRALGMLTMLLLYDTGTSTLKPEAPWAPTTVIGFSVVIIMDFWGLCSINERLGKFFLKL